MKLFLTTLSVLIAASFGQSVSEDAEGSVRRRLSKDRKDGYETGKDEHDGRYGDGPIKFLLQYTPGTIYSSLLDPGTFPNGNVNNPPATVPQLAPSNNATFLFTVSGAARVPALDALQMQSLGVNFNVFSAPQFSEFQIVIEPGNPIGNPVNIKFIANGVFTNLQLVLPGETFPVGGQLTYTGEVNGLEGSLIITGGTGVFQGATGTIFQQVTTTPRTTVGGTIQVPTLVELLFHLTLA